VLKRREKASIDNTPNTSVSYRKFSVTVLSRSFVHSFLSLLGTMLSFINQMIESLLYQRRCLW